MENRCTSIHRNIKYNAIYRHQRYDWRHYMNAELNYIGEANISLSVFERLMKKRKILKGIKMLNWNPKKFDYINVLIIELNTYYSYIYNGTGWICFKGVIR